MQLAKRSFLRLCRISKKLNRQYSSSSKGSDSSQKSSASTASATVPVRNERVKKYPLDVPYPGVVAPESADMPQLNFDTSVTKLDNGMHVGSTLRFGKYCTIGVSIKSGSRYETNSPLGISHIIEKLGFMSSRNYASKEDIMRELEAFGAICDSQTSRDITVYAISTETAGVERLMKMLADVVLRPKFTQEDVLNAKQTALYEVEDMQMRPEQEAMVMEMAHSAAWGSRTLGLPRYIPLDKSVDITRSDILKYMSRNFRPERMAVSGVGVDHNLLVDLSKEYFGSSDTAWNEEGLHALDVEDEKAVYTGGEYRLQKDFGQFNAGPMPVPNLAHMAIGLESVSHSHPLFIPACVLNVLMGGGGSFSAGGPGKGMYSRLYTSVLNTRHWVYNATAHNSSYADSGFFCIYGSAEPEYMKHLTYVLIDELYGMKKNPSQEEFERAKKQLQSMLLMNLEARPVIFEDIGRQLLAHGHYKSPHEYLTLIENVSPADIQELAKMMLKSKPCIAALGDISDVPVYNKIVDSSGQLHSSSKSYFRR